MLPLTPRAASKVCLAMSMPITIDSGTFLFSHPCQCDLGSNNCSGSKGTVTTMRHNAYSRAWCPQDRTGCIAAPETTDAVDLWTVGFADSHLCAARNPVDGPWKTLRVSHRPPTGRWLTTSSTAYQQRSYIFMIREDTRIELAASPRPKPRTLWICGQSASPIPTFALRAILWTARGKRCGFPTARPQAGG
jgi:hypothetical protein